MNRQISRSNQKTFYWSTFHAFMITLTTLLTIASHHIVFVLSGGLISFILLFIIHLRSVSWRKLLGTANIITIFRLLAVVLLAGWSVYFSNTTIFLAGVIILMADGLDGKIAKRYNQVSDFGEYFDKETDAYYINILCLIIYSKNILWDWIVILGLLRYLWIIFIFFWQTSVIKERRSRFGRYIYVFVNLALLSAFLPFPHFYKVAIIIAGILLVYSFGKDFLWAITEKLSQN